MQEALTKTASDIKTLKHITNKCLNKKANEVIHLKIASIEEILKHRSGKSNKKPQQDSDEED